MKTFNEYVLDWWHDYLDTHKDDTKRLMEEIIGEEEYVEDYLEDGQTPYDWLYAQTDATEVYCWWFGSDAKPTCFDDMPDTESFLKGMFKQAADWFSCQAHDELPSFTQDFVPDMAYSASEYMLPEGWFEDLFRSGCVSGMVGMLIYHTQCYETYMANYEDMEEFKEQMEDELGEPIRNKNRQPHHTFICWLCYEELAHIIARNLFPDTF